MTTPKTPGDILAGRIQAIITTSSMGRALYSDLTTALDEYRRPLPSVANPILTPEQIADGWLEWHGGECPVWGGSKPTVRLRSGEINGKYTADTYCWDHWNINENDIIAYRPDPYAALKKAHSEGKVIQLLHVCGNWNDCNPDWSAKPNQYRVEPEPVLVPLGPDDVPPGSAVRKSTWAKNLWSTVLYVCAFKIGVADSGEITYADLRDNGWLITRDGGRTWQKCEKPQEDGK